MLALSAGFAITIAACRLLLLTLGLVRVAAALERGWAELALGEVLPAQEPGGTARTRAVVEGDSGRCSRRAPSGARSWYLLLLLPVGIILFVVAVTIWSVALSGVTVPLCSGGSRRRFPLGRQFTRTHPVEVVGVRSWWERFALLAAPWGSSTASSRRARRVAPGASGPDPR
jgi:hypothetical protein